jgi:hypothetical protein
MPQFPKRGCLVRAPRPPLRCDVGGSWRCFGPSRNTNWTENTTTWTQLDWTELGAVGFDSR